MSYECFLCSLVDHAGSSSGQQSSSTSSKLQQFLPSHPLHSCLCTHNVCQIPSRSKGGSPVVCGPAVHLGHRKAPEMLKLRSPLHFLWHRISHCRQRPEFTPNSLPHTTHRYLPCCTGSVPLAPLTISFFSLIFTQRSLIHNALLYRTNITINLFSFLFIQY